jgi:hypothetical protein
MHITKGVFESTIGLLLDISSKMKDGLNTRKDLQVLEIREELHPQKRPNEKLYLPPASYTLTNEEKKVICKCLCGIRVPTEFSTNIKNLVSMSDLKVSDYNTHDFLTMLSLFFVITIGAINHPYLKMVITCMCYFFIAISKKVINIVELDEIRKKMQVTMCQFEICFPTSFFNMIKHYMIHPIFPACAVTPSHTPSYCFINLYSNIRLLSPKTCNKYVVLVS